jgi:hypothetical protein
VNIKCPTPKAMITNFIKILEHEIAERDWKWKKLLLGQKGEIDTLQENVKQLVAVDMQELKPYPKLNLSQTQTFCLYCSVSPLWSHRVVPLKYLNTMTSVSIEAWVENAACQLVAVCETSSQVSHTNHRKESTRQYFNSTYPTPPPSSAET